MCSARYDAPVLTDRLCIVLASVVSQFPYLHFSIGGSSLLNVVLLRAILSACGFAAMANDLLNVKGG